MTGVIGKTLSGMQMLEEDPARTEAPSSTNPQAKSQSAEKKGGFWTPKRVGAGVTIFATFGLGLWAGARLQGGWDENARQNTEDTMLNMAHHGLLGSNVIEVDLNRDNDVARLKIASAAGQICTGAVEVDDSGAVIKYTSYDAAGEARKPLVATSTAQTEAIFREIAANSLNCHPANG